MPGSEPSRCKSLELGMTLAWFRDSKEEAREETRVWEERTSGVGRGQIRESFVCHGRSLDFTLSC